MVLKDVNMQYLLMILLKHCWTVIYIYIYMQILL